MQCSTHAAPFSVVILTAEPELATHLHILVHGQVVACKAGALAPDVAGDRAEDAHGQLQHDDEADLEVQEVVVRAWSGST